VVFQKKNGEKLKTYVILPLEDCEGRSDRNTMNRRKQIEYIYLDREHDIPFFIDIEKDLTLHGSYHPHRHAYHEIIWVQAGTGRHSIDGRTVEIVPNSFSLIAQGQVHAFLEADQIQGYTLGFTDSFLNSESRSGQLSFRTMFNYLYEQQTFLIPAEERGIGDRLLELIVQEVAQAQKTDSYEVLRHLVCAFLAQIERIQRLSQRQRIAATSSQEQTYQAFLQLLEEQVMRHHAVTFYAQALNRSPDQLNSVLQEMLGKTTKRVILERLLLEARRKLQFTDLSVKEVAASLGFRDQFHFSKLFKQEIGFTPLEYREQSQKSITFVETY
jgi:AraC family transcriptional activator of pobA